MSTETLGQRVSHTPLIALLGNPNCGKTALFNRLTGARQKVANYAGVTIERKEGSFTSPAGHSYKVLDLPGAYSLSATTPDEAITRDVVAGLRADEQAPDTVVCVVSAVNLRLNLRLVLEIQRLGLPMVLALNMPAPSKSKVSVVWLVSSWFSWSLMVRRSGRFRVHCDAGSTTPAAVSVTRLAALPRKALNR